MTDPTDAILSGEEKPRQETVAQNLRSVIYERVKNKKERYRNYNFEREQEEAFATFFDLAQEYTSLDVLYLICVLVPREFLKIESSLYVIQPKTSRLEKVCTSTDGLIPREHRVAAESHCWKNTVHYPDNPRKKYAALLPVVDNAGPQMP